MTRLRRWFEGRSERDRAFIGWAIAVAALLVMAAFWIQAERSRERLALELPALRASIARLEGQAEEARRLRALPAAAAPTAAPLASLATNAGGLAGAQVNVIDERRVRLTAADAAFAALLEWLGNARATHGMRVESARLEALPTPGRVRAEIVLTRS